ncbi:serine/threonine protein kinase [Nonomuraea jiangxiensis]|nr:serine/threonine-protein kinase [Nonomuraea jiangxiensis]
MQALTEADPAQLGDYALVGALGRGPRSVVYLGRSAYGQVAIRLLAAGDVEAQRAMAAAAEQVTEPSVAQVLATGMHGDRVYVVSEYVQGVSLAESVRQEGPHDPARLHWLATGTAAALAAIHQAGLAHLAFTPANVMLGAQGPKVVDFGIVRPPEPAVIPAYLSPEQVAGHPAGPASDVFSWAATMIYAATGVPPFGEDNAPAVAHRVLNISADLSRLPAPLQPILNQCLAKQPAYRPTAQQVLASLHGAAPNQPAVGQPPAHAPTTTYFPPHPQPPAPTRAFPHSPPPAQPPGYAPPPPAPSKSSTSLVIGLVAGLVVLLAAGAAGVVFLADRQRQQPVAIASPNPSPATSETPDSGPTDSPDSGPSESSDPEAGESPSPRESPSSSESPSPSESPSSDAGAGTATSTPERTSVAGRWTGTYVCNQGKTALDLTITESSPGRLKATFAFEADPSNPDVPSGSFAMSGRLTGRVLDLKGVRWIDRPGEYIMVNLQADLTEDRPSTITGNVLGGGCSTFTIERS